MIKIFRLFFLFYSLYTTFICAAWVSNQGGMINLETKKDFDLIFGGPGSAVQGDFAATGNSALNGDKSTEYFAGSTPVMAQSDPQIVTLGTNQYNQNASSAPLKLPSFVRANHIIWAGLFWEGQVHGNANSVNGVEAQIAGWNTVHLKLPNGDIKTITAPIGDNNRQHTTYRYTHLINGSFRHHYGVYVDVTDIIRNSGYTVANNLFTVGNIMTTAGADSFDTMYFNHIFEPQGFWFGPLHMGHYGGWALIVVYSVDQKTAANHPSSIKYKNVSIYNGFDLFSFWSTPGSTFSTTIEVSGFRTPTNGKINSKMLFFGGGGDYGMNGDIFDIEDGNNPGNYIPLTNSQNTGDQKFNGTFTDLNKSIISGKNYFQGMDLDIFDSSNMMAHGQTKTHIRFGVLQFQNYIDQVFPLVIGFSTELYVPKLCYDYTVQQNNFDITDSNRTIRTTGGGELSINLALQSQEADFDLEHSKLSVELIPAADTSFKDAYYSPNNVNTYIPAIYATEHTSTHPMIAIGEYVTPAGGRIKALQRYFAQFNYDLTSTSYSGRFEVDLNTTINFGSGPVSIYKSTRDGTLTRCPQTNGYNPRYGSFNVERHNSGDSTTAPEIKYPLYTQVVGKDFDFDVVAYQKDPAPDFHQELTLDGYTVAVELINARHFQDQNATFLCNNPNPAIIQNLDASGTKEVLARFQNSSRVDMSTLNISVDTALRSAAFRIWYIVDGNNTIVPYTCTDPNDNSCFQNLYDTYIEPSDTTLQASGTRGFCTVETIGGKGCSDYVNQNTGARGCYACLRDFFSKAVCSRDNFSIRPVSYRLSLIDNNEGNTTQPVIHIGNNITQNRLDIAAGYLYRLDGNATAYQNYPYARGYKQLFASPSLPVRDLESFLRFETNGTCFSSNDSERGIYFEDGRIRAMVEGSTIQFDNGNLFSFSNAGDYSLHIKDNNWTIVDQARYQYKTFPNINDCIADSPQIATAGTEMSGCEIRSDLGIYDNGQLYYDLALHYYPYSYDLSGIALKIDPNGEHLFMSDLDASYYQNAANLGNTMSALYEGNITARGKQGTRLTNYTDTCAATDVRLQIKRDTNASEDQLDALYGIKMQQYLIYGSNPLKTAYDDTKTGKDANITLSKAAFEDNSTGTAHIRLYTTFKKPLKSKLPSGEEGIPPIKVNYLEINATGDSAQSNADMETHTPVGRQPFDRNVTFYYARVVPTKRFYQTEQDSIATPLNIVVYSPHDPAVSRTVYDLNGTSSVSYLSSNWYEASGLFANPADYGTSDLNLTRYSGYNVQGYIEVNGTISRAQKIDKMPYEITATQPNLITSTDATQSQRPVTYKIEYTSVPWLEYDIDTQTFRVRFIPKPTAWTGYGKTGHVVGKSGKKSDDIKRNKSKRLEW